MTWSRDLIAADAVGVLVDADRCAICGDDVAAAHLRIVDGQPSDLATDQMGRTTMVYVAIGALPAIRIGETVTVCDRAADGTPARPGTDYTVVDLVTRGPFLIVSVVRQQQPMTASYE